MWICIAPCRDHTSKALRYGMRSQGISQFNLHTPCSSANGMNHIPAFAVSAEVIMIGPIDGNVSEASIVASFHVRKPCLALL